MGSDKKKRKADTFSRKRDVVADDNWKKIKRNIHNNHSFKDDGTGQCRYIINDYVGPCGCKEDNEIHDI